MAPGALASLALLGFSVFMAWSALGLRLGSPSQPGPGYFPFWISAGLALVSLAILVRELRVPGAARFQGRWRPILTVTVATLAYAPLLGLLGFVATSTLFLCVLLRGMGSPWPSSLGIAAGIALMGHLVFARWLLIQFPRGPFGF